MKLQGNREKSYNYEVCIAYDVPQIIGDVEQNFTSDDYFCGTHLERIMLELF